MIFSFICILRFFINCVDTSNGTYIIKVKIHLDEQTLLKIYLLEKAKSLKSTIGKREHVRNYLNRIFNEFNTDIAKYNVQIVGDFNVLLIEELDLGIDKKGLCSNELIASVMTARSYYKLSWPVTDGMGLTILGVSCLTFPPNQIPFHLMPSFGCGKLATIFVIDPFTLKIQLKLILKSLITNGVGLLAPTSSRIFKTALLKYAKLCTVKNNLIGKFNSEVSYVEHTTEQKIEIKENKEF